MQKNLQILFLLSLLMISIVANGQFCYVSGLVTDSITGKPLASVNVYDNISKTGTITDEKGHYQILLKAGKMQLIFSYEKYEQQAHKKQLNNNLDLNIKLLHKDTTNKSKIDTTLQKEHKTTNTAKSSASKKRKFGLF